MALDAEYKKLLAGDAWAADGDRTDPESTSVQPVLARNVGFPSSYSDTETPARSRINQLFRELYGAAKELRMGVSPYDATVDYPVNAIVQHLNRLWRASVAHDSSSPVAPAASGQSAWIEVSTAGAITRNVPDTIGNSDVFIDADDGSSFRVYWNAPDDNNDAITQYDIRYAKNDSGFTNPDGITEVNNYQQGTLITLTGDDAGESDIFYVQVKARNGQGTGTYPSTVGKQVRSSPLAPEQIKYFTAVAGDGQVTLNWYSPFLRGMEREKYVVEWKSGNQAFTRTGTRHKDVSSGTSTTVTGLTNNTQYTFRISVITTRSSIAVSAFTVDATPNSGVTTGVPATPANLTAIKGNGSDVIAYTTTIPDNNGSKITSFKWEMRIEVDGGNTPNAWAAPPGGNSETTNVPYNRFANLSLGDSLDNVWEIRMIAVNANGDSLPSNVAKRSPVYPTTPSKPTMDVEGRTTPANGGGTIAYITEDFSDGGSPITDIEWQRKLKSESANAWLRVNANDTSPFIYTRTESVGAEVEYRVRAKNEAGTGPWSDVEDVVAPGRVPSSAGRPTAAVTGVQAIANDSSGRPRAVVYLVNDVLSSTRVSRFDFEYRVKDDPNASWATITKASDVASWVVIDSGLLVAGTEYEFRAFATNDVGKASQFVRTFFTPSNVFAPSTPVAPFMSLTRNNLTNNSFLYLDVSFTLGNISRYNATGGGSFSYRLEWQRRYGSNYYFPGPSSSNWSLLTTSPSYSALSVRRSYTPPGTTFPRSLDYVRIRGRVTNSVGTSPWTTVQYND